MKNSVINVSNKPIFCLTGLSQFEFISFLDKQLALTLLKEITPVATYKAVGSKRKLKMAEILATSLQIATVTNIVIVNQKIAHDIVLSESLGVTPMANRVLIQSVNCKLPNPYYMVMFYFCFTIKRGPAQLDKHLF